MEAGSSNWQKACYVPTKSDALVVTFRRWLNKYARGQIDWGTKFSGALSPTPPREQLLDRQVSTYQFILVTLTFSLMRAVGSVSVKNLNIPSSVLTQLQLYC